MGFFCQHKYTDIYEKSEKIYRRSSKRSYGYRRGRCDLDNYSPFLKGEDAVIYEITKFLNRVKANM